jgi:alginate O-acetyltransferase complex protein AlgI
MPFNSLVFLIFFPFVAFAFYACPPKVRWLLLLGASYFFYASWHPKYLLILLAVTVISYLAGVRLEKEKRPVARRLILWGSLLTSLGVLFVFKYFNFFSSTLGAVLEEVGATSAVPVLNLLLPLGISFFTLQTISYMLDVYRGILKPEKHLGIYALFVAFFPQLVAGPIARGSQLLPQFHQVQTPDYENIVSGLQRMAWGFFKKLVIADRLALFVNIVYGNPRGFSGLPLIIATYAFAFQIYCDFSGYVDIALGAAKVMGFTLVENFQQPYAAQSVPDFWRRWHISLSNWLRDYIFYPLRRTMLRHPLFSETGIQNGVNLVLPPLVTMLVSGLWHGASWTFVVWGALHGMMMVVGVVWGQMRLKGLLHLPEKVAIALKIFVTFHAVTFAWIFFRAKSLSDAVYIVRHLFVNLDFHSSVLDLMPGGVYEWAIALLALLLVEVGHWLQNRNGNVRGFVHSQPVWLRWPMYYALVLVIFMFGKFGLTEFIYSQF